VQNKLVAELVPFEARTGDRARADGQLGAVDA